MPALAARTRIEAISGRGELICGLPRNVPGFAVLDDRNRATGFDADMCREIAATILGTPEAVRFVQVDSIDQFIETDTIDLVFHGLTSTSQREAKWNIAFGPATFIDGQTFAVRASDTRDTAKGTTALRGPICIENSPSRIASLRSWLARSNARNPVFVFPAQQDAASAFRSRYCAAWSGDASMLGSSLAGKDARLYRILSERLSVEPLAPVVRARDQDLLENIATTLSKLVAPMDGNPAISRYDQLYERHFGGKDWPTQEPGANPSRAWGGVIGP